MLGPMTLIVVVVLALLLFVGLSVLRRGMREPMAGAGSGPCAKCGHHNAADAHFCGHCGAQL